MMIIGCDFQTRYQQIAMMEEATGELTERRLDHESGEAQEFYRNLAGWGNSYWLCRDGGLRRRSDSHGHCYRSRICSL
jgi:hypothetical protein